jgi:uncharacterized membrane protein
MPTISADRLARAGLMGATSGSRGTLGFAALAVSAGPRMPGAPYTTAALLLAALGELVGDKLPNTPSRLSPRIFAGRLISGALSAAILAHRDRTDRTGTAIAAVVGAGAAAATAWGGVNWRRFASSKLGSDLPGALIEDGATVGLAAAATR